jgi:peptide/nickel transport system permease protein
MKSNINRNKRGVFTILLIMILLTITMLCFAAPLLTNYDPNDVDLISADSPPNSSHLLGCDELGRDIYSRMLYGGRISMTVGFTVAFIQLTIGVGMGMTSGYFGGWIDIMMMKFAELIQCFPFFILAISLVSVVGAGFWSVVIVLGVLGWPSIYFIIRAESLKLRESEFVLAAKTLGASGARVIFKHILPNVAPLMLVQVTLSISSAILSESSLSFLGMGIMPPNSSWGNILMAARTMSVLKNNWWQWMPAGICIFFVVLCVNLIGQKLSKDTKF